ncbi:MAG: thiamine pyrophosphate-binding protein [Alphaproteobacteria bacterium]|nr:thiamine pyrophosphate-binding protein [Alphaproteobacteria bacterium]
MKLAEYVADFIAKLGVGQVFGVTGGGAMHLNDAMGGHPDLEFVVTHQEQSAAMAAEAHARMTGRIGVCHVTTGPGGTNAITGVAGAWIDSIPMLVVSGQVTTGTMIAGAQLRQLGVQEIDIIPMVRPITKYAVTVTEPGMIRHHLEKAVHLATTGRPGPVWIDLPLDITNERIDPASLPGYTPERSPVRPAAHFERRLAECVRMLGEAKRPVLIAGNGIRLAGAVAEFVAIVERLRIPVITSWNASDLIDSGHPCHAGRAGLFGDRAGNFTVQNADLLLIVGSRMSIPQTGHNTAQFAPHARQIVVDVDENELMKPTLRPDVAMAADAKVFLTALLARGDAIGRDKGVDGWLETVADWRRRYPVVLDEYRTLPSQVNSFHFIDRLADRLPSDAVVVTDMGTSFTCTMQTFAIKKGQRLFTSSGLASMGFGLPGAIGACYAAGRRQVICVSGDGGLMFNVQELQTLAHNKLPVVLFVLANRGYLTMKLMQHNHFGRFVGSEPSSGVSCPDFVELAKAFGIPGLHIRSNRDLEEHLDAILASDGPMVCEIEMPEMQPLIPRVQTMKGPDGRLLPTPMEDMYPFLDRAELRANMVAARAAETE